MTASSLVFVEIQAAGNPPLPQNSKDKPKSEWYLVGVDSSPKSASSMVAANLEEPINPDKYRVVVGDKFKLVIKQEFQEPNIFDIEVMSEGKAVLPYLDEIQAEGLTLSVFSKMVKESYKAAFPEYDADILLYQLGEFQVNIVGGVNNPGVLSVNSATRLSSAISGAGGLKPYGSERNIVIQNGKSTIVCDLFSYQHLGRMEQNPYLAPKSIIIIPPKFGDASVKGEVNEPGKYEIIEGETILDLLTFSKGLTTFADKDNVLVKRVVLSSEGKAKSEKKVVSMEGILSGKEKSLVLQDGDEITFYAYTQDKIGTVEIRGNVQEPGFYDLFDGMTVTDLIRAAGGFLKFMGKTKAILLTRENGGDLQKREIDLSGYPDLGNIELQSGARLYIFNPESQMGYVSVEGSMVMSPGFYPYYPGITAYEAINMAGGIMYSDIKEVKDKTESQAPTIVSTFQEDKENKKEKAAQGIISLRNSFILRSTDSAPGAQAEKYLPLRLDELFYKQDMSFDVRLEIGDRLIVGVRKDDYVMVNGSVRTPGELPFVANMNAQYYASKAGLTADSDLTSLVILRNGNDVLRDPNATILPGDIISVKNKNKETARKNVSMYSQIISSIFMIHSMIENSRD